MASVDFQKLKTAQDVKSKLLHCDSEKRLTHEHQNENISKEHTNRNIQTDLSYDDACMLYEHTIAELDKDPKANKRKDRVTCFGLTIPISNDIPNGQRKKARERILDVVKKQYPECVIVADYLHADEQHWYTDAETGQKRLSMAHEHIYIVPIKDGKLNGKWFSSANNMTKLNNSMHMMFEKEFDVQFMDGTQRKSKKSVGRLKMESEKKEIEIEKEKIIRERVELRKEIQSEHALIDNEIDRLEREREEFEREKEEFEKERKEVRNMKALYDLKYKEQEQREQNKKSLEERAQGNKQIQSLLNKLNK